MRYNLLYWILLIAAARPDCGGLPGVESRKDAIFRTKDAGAVQQLHFSGNTPRPNATPQTKGKYDLDHFEASSDDIANWRRYQWALRQLGALSNAQSLRGGAAGAWRVVQTEARKERQAVRNVLLYYPNLIGV